MNKIAKLEEALSRLAENQTLMIGGFAGIGTPEAIVDGIIEKGIKNLTVIANDTAFVDKGIGKLVVNKLLKRVIVSHIGTNKETGRQMNAGEIEVELVPQGTLIERIRCGGAGLGGVLTPTGVGTVVEEGKEKIIRDGKVYLLELPLRADVALVKAWKADTYGNLVYRRAARNFNPTIALAADFVIVEAEEIVEAGVLDPDEIITPGGVVDMIIRG
ncbi:acetate CoA-transferase subunit alpha [Geosporobacter ferrireducens]|uniref:acetate CoA-transferase subunit alpha n=1 Tax=Geosporobacter ferrireducens TaxID=1424294 RepID=UPI00139E3C30|nr:acetate CoA-transferase subunit alpha [Geosporobacter ferrireducens]MTI56577.1 acetate CoA-transferase subunit alpha [Geosporobacter ferrireducens]